ncbi:MULTISPECIES: hypothetical protein [Nocardiaceae]|uniref:hypothetical protein n=1 Tax=Nocardiaceae TaxID=85025 RepID=UPI0012D36E4B|nr:MULTISPECIES: hypothetical protein [Rhodococcus]
MPIRNVCVSDQHGISSTVAAMISEQLSEPVLYPLVLLALTPFWDYYVTRWLRRREEE